MLYYTYIYPHLIYCIPIWGGGQCTSVNKVAAFQKKAAYLICNLIQITNLNYLARVHPAAHVHKLLLISELFIYQLMKLMLDIYYKKGAVKYNLITNIFAFLNVPMRISGAILC